MFPRKPYLIPNENGQSQVIGSWQSIPVFRPKRPKNPTRWGGTYLYGLYKGVPPPPGFEPSPDLSPLGLPSKISEKYPRPCHMPIAPAQPHLSSDERAGHGGRIVGVKPE